jgi:hypothetical protein
MFRKTKNVKGLTTAIKVNDKELKILNLFLTNKMNMEKNIFNRFRLIFNESDRLFIEKIEKSKLKIKDFIEFKSGLISKIGQKNIISDKKLDNDWREGITSGGEIKNYKINWQGNFIQYKKELIKSGFGNVEYF